MFSVIRTATSWHKRTKEARETGSGGGGKERPGSNNRPDQTVRTNVILAGEDTVATDALVAHLLGFNTWDIEFLHMAAQRELGVMDLAKADLAGDDPGPYVRQWGKPRPWWGRCNREWLVSANPSSDLRSWARRTIPTDTLHLAAAGDRFRKR